MRVVPLRRSGRGDRSRTPGAAALSARLRVGIAARSRTASIARHDAELRDASRDALGAPYTGLFERVLSRAVERGLVSGAVDIATLAEVFPAIAYQRVADKRTGVIPDGASGWPAVRFTVA